MQESSERLSLRSDPWVDDDRSNVEDDQPNIINWLLSDGEAQTVNELTMTDVVMVMMTMMIMVMMLRLGHCVQHWRVLINDNVRKNKL